MKREQHHIFRFLKRAAVFAVFFSAGTALILSVPLVSNRLVNSLQIYPALTASGLAEAAGNPMTAIVVLGAGRRFYAPEFGGESVDEIGLERLRYGAQVARQTHLPILVSGGLGGLGGTGGAPLAKLMADTLAQDYGIRANWQETASRNTAENAIYSSRLFRQAGIARVLLVTHAWHMKRARAAFVGNGMTVIPAPTGFYGRTREVSLARMVPSTRAFRMSGFAIHEILGSAWYAWKYGY